MAAADAGFWMTSESLQGTASARDCDSITGTAHEAGFVVRLGFRSELRLTSPCAESWEFPGITLKAASADASKEADSFEASWNWSGIEYVESDGLTCSGSVCWKRNGVRLDTAPRTLRRVFESSGIGASLSVALVFLPALILVPRKVVEAVFNESLNVLGEESLVCAGDAVLSNPEDRVGNSSKVALAITPIYKHLAAQTKTRLPRSVNHAKSRGFIVPFLWFAKETKVVSQSGQVLPNCRWAKLAEYRAEQQPNSADALLLSSKMQAQANWILTITWGV